MFGALTQWRRFLLMFVEADDYEFYEILTGNESVTSWLCVYDYDGDLFKIIIISFTTFVFCHWTHPPNFDFII